MYKHAIATHEDSVESSRQIAMLIKSYSIARAFQSDISPTKFVRATTTRLACVFLSRESHLSSYMQIRIVYTYVQCNRECVSATRIVFQSWPTWYNVFAKIVLHIRFTCSTVCSLPAQIYTQIASRISRVVSCFFFFFFLF